MKVTGRVNGDGSSVIQVTLLPEEMRRVLALVSLLSGDVFCGRSDMFDNALETIVEVVKSKDSGREFEVVLLGR